MGRGWRRGGDGERVGTGRGLRRGEGGDGERVEARKGREQKKKA